MIGPDQFYFKEQYDHRRVTIEGFGGPSHTIRNMRIGSGITAVAIDNMNIMQSSHPTKPSFLPT